MRETEEAIREFSGMILGYIVTMENGDQKALDFGRRILGYYRKQQNHTTDFYGRIVARGNCVVSFIYNNKK